SGMRGIRGWGTRSSSCSRSRTRRVGGGTSTPTVGGCGRTWILTEGRASGSPFAHAACSGPRQPDPARRRRVYDASMDPPAPVARTGRARTGELDEVYAATFRDPPSSICILRMRDLTFVAANPAFERASGRSVADLVGRRPDEIGLIDPADAATLHR